MKGIILAAGMGTRLAGMTKDRPKGMVEFLGRPLLAWQVRALRENGIDDIVVVGGYRAEAIDVPGITLELNPRFAETNMVETLLCVRHHLAEGFVLSYSDVVYDAALVAAVKGSPHHIAVVGDSDWLPYWRLRLPETWQEDMESFAVDREGLISEIGRPVKTVEGVTHRYVGLMKFSPEGAAALVETYDRKRAVGESWEQSGKAFEQGYMTDILHEVGLHGPRPRLVEVVNGWMEFDSPEDLALGAALKQDGRLGMLGRFNPEEELALRQALQYQFASYDSVSLESFCRERMESLSRLGIELMNPVSALKDVRRLVRKALSGLGPHSRELVGWDGQRTDGVLQESITQLVEDGSDENAVATLDVFQKRFEVKKALFAFYEGPSFAGGGGPFLRFVPYALLSLGLSLRFADSGNYNYLNSVLKLNDLLSDAILPVSDEEKMLFSAALAAEQINLGGGCGTP